MAERKCRPCATIEGLDRAGPVVHRRRSSSWSLPRRRAPPPSDHCHVALHFPATLGVRHEETATLSIQPSGSQEGIIPPFFQACALSSSLHCHLPLHTIHCISITFGNIWIPPPLSRSLVSPPLHLSTTLSRHLGTHPIGLLLQSS